MNDKTSTHSKSNNPLKLETKPRSNSFRKANDNKEPREPRDSFSRDREFREREGEISKNNFNDREKNHDGRDLREPRYNYREREFQGGFRDDRGDRMERGGRDRFREPRREYRDYRERDNRDRRDSRERDYDRRDKSFKMYEGRRKSRSGSPKYIKKSSRENSAENAGKLIFYKKYLKYSLDQNCVYVTNLSRTVKEYELEDVFAKYGTLKSVKIVKDPFTKESRGFAFITYEKNSQALESIKEMNGQQFSGRQISVEISKRNKERTSTPGIYLGPSSAKRMRPKYDSYRNNRSFRSRSRSIHDRPRYYSKDRQERPRRFSRSRSQSLNRKR